MPLYRVGWLVPICQPPIRDAWLKTDAGQIVAFGHSRPGDLTTSQEIDLGNVAVLPGLVNAHAHLELSWLRDRIPDTDDFPTWIRSVISARRGASGTEGYILAAIRSAVDELRSFGTALVGDISNTLVTSSVFAERNTPAVVFHELLGFRSEDAARILSEGMQRLQRAPADPCVRHTLAAHAPYSVSPALFRSIHEAVEQRPSNVSSVHLGESAAEIEFLEKGTGPWRGLLEELGAWDAAWVVPGCRPVDYLQRLGVLNDRLLVVHGVQLEPDELTSLAAAGATLVTCPRGTQRTGAGVPPVEHFFESGGRVAVGTDSLASVPDLNIFAEVAEMRRLAPGIPARLLLQAATINGAQALGFDSELGSIEPGKRDQLLAVELEGSPVNVEECLVCGIDGAQIRWLTS